MIPLLLGLLAMRYLVPRAVSAQGLEGALSAFAGSHTLVVLVALFVILASLVRYWSAWLPGGRYLSSLPNDLVERVPRGRIAEAEAACATLEALESSTIKGRLLQSPAEIQASVASASAELRAELTAGKWSRVARAHEKLRALTGQMRRASRAKLVPYAATLVVAALLALQMRARFLQTYEVNGTSMLPTLTPGELLAGRVAAYAPGRLPQRGDLVVLRVQVDGHEQELIKRVIGLPGDHIGMWGVHPIINGWTLPLCDVGSYYSPDDETARSGDPGARVLMEFLGNEAYLTLQAVQAAPFPEYVVKPGEVFVLGDNRSNSRDSHNFDQGAPRGFPLSDIKAKVTRVLLSRTRRGDVQVSSVLRRPAIVPALEGTDMSDVETRVKSCLAIRPQLTSPPSPQSTALASGAP
ncbi:MAG TPA: signal peptidase I [Polyangiaceae bacterium]|nr:signal peptidase I [Polyangiaceae bacterium]